MIMLVSIFFSEALITSSVNATPSDAVPIYALQEGEEFVFGKIGLKKDGDFNYSFVIVRKPNSGKVIYAREFDPYSARPLQGGGKMRIDEKPKDYDKYDFWVIFNGEKFGPYDRVVEMYQDDSNIDNWVSRDGQKISFAGVKGQKYEPIIGNQKEVGFWNSFQTPVYDPQSGIDTYAILWSTDNYKLFEKGKMVSSDWKLIKNITYSEDGQNLLYIGAKDNKKEQSIYLNHQKIAGPYYIASQVGFVPGTNQVYFSGFQENIVNNSVEYNYEYVAIGSKRIIIPDGYSVGNFNFADGKVSFYVSNVNKAYKGTDPYKQQNIIVYEYNTRTSETVKHEGYALTIQTNIAGNTFYYTTYNSNGDALLVMQGGVILDKVSKSERGVDGNAFFKVSPNGSVYTYYNQGFMKPYRMRKDGQPFTKAGDKIAWIEEISFNHTTQEDQIIIDVDESVGAKQRKLLKGDYEFSLSGDTWAGNIYFSQTGKNIYSKHRRIISSNDWRYQLFKNGKPISEDNWTLITGFCQSTDGERYAMLVTDCPIMGLGGGGTENDVMNVKLQLILDGRIVDGNHGYPVWSNLSGNFLIIQERNGIVEMAEL